MMFTHPEGVPAKPILERRLKFNLATEAVIPKGMNFNAFMQVPIH